jgi:hypothetical protein
MTRTHAGVHYDQYARCEQAYGDEHDEVFRSDVRRVARRLTPLIFKFPTINM